MPAEGCIAGTALHAGAAASELRFSRTAASQGHHSADGGGRGGAIRVGRKGQRRQSARAQQCTRTGRERQHSYKRCTSTRWIPNCPPRLTSSKSVTPSQPIRHCMPLPTNAGSAWHATQPSFQATTGPELAASPGIGTAASPSGCPVTLAAVARKGGAEGSPANRILAPPSVVTGLASTRPFSCRETGWHSVA